ncbi:MAG TPA: hypothetical protein VK402_05735 [Blastococcus sp.]|nr:hypothetical protein [Blastococcus sp.]
MTHTLDTPRGMRGVVPDARTTRLGAGLGITGLVLTAAGIALAAPTAATLSSSPSDIVGFYTEGGMARTVAGGFVEILGIVSFLPFAVMLTSRVRAAGGRAELLAATPGPLRPSTSPSPSHPACRRVPQRCGSATTARPTPPSSSP